MSLLVSLFYKASMCFLYIDREATSVRVDVRVISTIQDVQSSFNKDTFTT